MSQTATRSGGISNTSQGSAALLIGWSAPEQGTETKASQALSDFLGYVKALSERGEVSGVEPIIFEPHGTQMSGCVFLRGDTQRLNALRSSQEWLQRCAKMQRVLPHLDVIGGYLGPTFDTIVQSWGQTP